MGSSKKHKKESKHKRKHRSQSGERDSKSGSPEEKRKKHKKSKSHKHRSRRKDDTDSDAAIKTEIEVAIPGFGSDSPKVEQKNVSLKVEEDAPHGDGSSLSIDETNRIRLKLGLKPLEGSGTGIPSTTEAKTEEFVHQPPENISALKKREEIKEKLKNMKRGREINKKLNKVKTLGDDSDEDAASWVKNMKRKQREKLEREKREKQFQDMDEAFGVSDLVKKEIKSEKQSKYTSRDLKGMNVEHSLDTFREGTTILTLKDADVLENDEDVLMNPNLEEVEKGKRNIETKRKGMGYKAYEEEEVDDLGFFKAKSVLSQYDEEIDGVQSTKFTIGGGGRVDTSWEKQKESMKQEIRARGESLKLPALKIASEYLTEEEMKIKKRKRKVRKVRKREVLKADDLMPLPGNKTTSGSGAIPGWEEGLEMTKVSGNTITSTTLKGPTEGDAIDDDDGEDLQRALDKARKAKLKKAAASASDTGAEKVADHLNKYNEVELEDPTKEYAQTISLNATNEFCRQLGAQIFNSIDVKPNHQEEKQEEYNSDMDVDKSEDELMDDVVNHSVTKQQENDEDGHAPIEAEPLAVGGLAGVLKLAQQKGYLQDTGEKGFVQVSTNTKRLIESQNYSIEDKNAVDHLDKYAHEKYSRDRSNRYDRGMTMDFDEKKNYNPVVNIEYVDEKGRSMNQKEAFRKLSHRFHGKGSGKMKTEKRMKKMNESDMMTKMSSTDTPLNTVAMMKAKLKQESSPFIVLSGAGKTLQAGGGPGHIRKQK